MASRELQAHAHRRARLKSSFFSLSPSPMEYRTLDLTLLFARDLKDVNLISKMDVYAIVSISGGSVGPQKAKTPVDREGGKNRAWNFTVKFTVDELSAQQDRLTLYVKLRCERVLGDKDIGEVVVPIKELLDSYNSSPSAAAAGEGKSATSVTYQVRKPSGKPKGELNFSFKFGDKVVAAAADVASSYQYAAATVDAAEPVTAHPAQPPPSAPYGSAPGTGPYPPRPQAGYGYPPPPPPGYAYPPAGQYSGYGYPPPPPQRGYGYYPAQQPQQPRKNNFGLGMGASLMGGLLGGLLIGDLAANAASAGGSACGSAGGSAGGSACGSAGGSACGSAGGSAGGF